LPDFPLPPNGGCASAPEVELLMLTSTGPFAAHGGGDPETRIFRRRDGEWRPLAGGLPEPLPAMPYALVAADGRLFAGLADGQLWESVDRGESWRACALSGAPLTELRALALGG